MGNRGFQGAEGVGGGSPILSKSSKKKSVKKSQKSAKLEKKTNRKNRIFFFTENGLKCIRNPTKHL